MKPPRWSRHLNIFHLHRGIQIFKRHLPSLLRLSPSSRPCISHPPTPAAGSVPTYGHGEKRSSSYRTELRPFPSPLLLFSLFPVADFGKVVRGRNFNVTSIQCPPRLLSLSLSLSHSLSRNVLLPHLPEPAESSPFAPPLRHPWLTGWRRLDSARASQPNPRRRRRRRRDAKIRETPSMEYRLKSTSLACVLEGDGFFRGYGREETLL